jgi:hypothetical protein
MMIKSDKRRETLTFSTVFALPTGKTDFLTARRAGNVPEIIVTLATQRLASRSIVALGAGHTVLEGDFLRHGAAEVLRPITRHAELALDGKARDQ